MTKIIYNARNMSGGRFWEELKHCRSNPSITLVDVHDFLKNSESRMELFANVILFAKEVAAGNINPLDVTLIICGETYLVALNGDLCRAQTLGDDLDRLPLSMIEEVIGFGRPSPPLFHSNWSWTSIGSSTTSTR